MPLFLPGPGPYPHPTVVQRTGGPVELAGTSRSGAGDANSFTTTTSWLHTPTVNQPKGVLVVVSQPLTTPDEISGVTYGGVAMSRTLSQASTQVEPSRGYIYFLGSNIPAGPQTVQVTRSATVAQQQAQCFTVTGTTDLQVVVDSSAGVNLGIIANPSTTANFTGSLPVWFGLALHFYGGAAPVSTGLRPDETYAYGHDPGAAVSMTYYRNQTVAAANTTWGYTTLASDDQFIMWVTLKEVVQYSFNPAISEDIALPVWRFKGRLATLTPDATDKGDWTVVGAASAHAAVTDASDASYIESTTTGNIERFNLTTTTLNAGEFVSGVRVRFKATTNADQTIEASPRATASAALYTRPYIVPVSSPVAYYESPMYAGAADPLAASGWGQLTQAKVDAMLVQFVLVEGAAQAATSKIYEAAVDLYLSTAQPKVKTQGRKLVFDKRSECRFVGVNWPEDVLNTPVSETKEKLLAHKDAGYDLFRFHIPTSRLRDASLWFLEPIGILTELLQWMNHEGLYADITMNASYTAATNPAWMESQTEAQRWDMRREVARTLCGLYETHPAVAFFCLINEGAAISGPPSSWWRLGDITGTGSPLYSEYIVKDPAARSFNTIWGDWLTDVLSVTDGIRLVAPTAIVGCGAPTNAYNLQPDLVTFMCSVGAMSPAVLLPHQYPDRAGFWRISVNLTMRQGLPVVLEEFFVDVVTFSGWIAEMDAVYQRMFQASGLMVMSEGYPANGYPSELTFTNAIHQMVLRWMETRMDQFKQTPEFAFRAGSRAIPPRVGGRV